MNGTQVTHEEVHRPGTETSAKWLAGGSAIEAIGGIAAIVLAIIGLTGLLPGDMAAIAAIVLGASLLLQGGAVMSGLRHFGASAGLGGAMSAESMGGIAAIVLGVLALLGTSPAILLAAAAIALGAGLLLGAGAMPFAGGTTTSTTGTLEEACSHAVMRATSSAFASGQAFIGIGAVVLGILAVVGIAPVTLELVAFLGLGAGVLFAGSALGTRAATHA